jgi:hypothetical protein
LLWFELSPILTVALISGYSTIASSIAYNYGCAVNVAFEPGIGKDYEASFSADGKQRQVRHSEIIKHSDGSVERNVVDTSRVKLCTYWYSQQGV